MPTVVKYGIKMWEYVCDECKSSIEFKKEEIRSKYDRFMDTTSYCVTCPNCKHSQNVVKHIPAINIENGDYGERG